MTTDFHPVQAGILRELLFHNGAKFASLNKLRLTNDHFAFHLKRLLAEGFVEKMGSKYFLTQPGKIVAGTLDTESLKTEGWGKASVAVTVKKTIKGETHILLQQRLKEPFFHYHGFINGKIRYGDTSEETAVRELKEETGLTGKPKLLGIFHKLRGPSRKEVKLDNYFFLYLVKNPEGKLINTAEGKNFWILPEEIKKYQTFPGFDKYWNTIVTEKFHPYSEIFIKVDRI